MGEVLREIQGASVGELIGAVVMWVIIGSAFIVPLLQNLWHTVSRPWCDSAPADSCQWDLKGSLPAVASGMFVVAQEIPHLLRGERGLYRLRVHLHQPEEVRWERVVPAPGLMAAYEEIVREWADLMRVLPEHVEQSVYVEPVRYRAGIWRSSRHMYSPNNRCSEHSFTSQDT